MFNNMKVIELNEDDGVEVYNMLQRIGANENAFNNEVYGMEYERYKEWLTVQCAWARGEQLPEGYVRQWTYWLYGDSIPIGYGKLREKVTEQSRSFGGNIGFAIDPLVRGNGCGFFLFQSLLKKAKENNIKEIFSTVEKYNYASKRIHEKCGGKLVNENDNRWFYDFSDALELM